MGGLPGLGQLPEMSVPWILFKEAALDGLINNRIDLASRSIQLVRYLDPRRERASGPLGAVFERAQNVVKRQLIGHGENLAAVARCCSQPFPSSAGAGAGRVLS